MASHAPRLRIGQLLVRGGFISPADLDRALAKQAIIAERLGEILISLGCLTRMELDAVLALHSDPAPGAAKPGAAELGTREPEAAGPDSGALHKLGEILLAAGAINPAQLAAALEAQKFDPRQIGEILVEAGHVSRGQVAAALGIQRKLIAASLAAVVSSAAVTGCGTGATLGGVKVYDGQRLKTPTAAYEQLDNVRGARVAYSGLALRRSVASKATHPLVEYDDGSVILEGVRFIKQGTVLQTDKSLPDNTCGQAALTMVLRYWLHDEAPSYQTVVDESNRFNLATTHQTMTNYLRYKGLEASPYKNGKLEHLKSEVDAGRPPIVLMQFSVPHYVVVIGYNEEQGEIIYHDSIDGPYMRLAQDEFKRAWYESDLKNIPLIGGQNYVGLTIAIGS